MASATASKNGQAKTLPVNEVRCGSTVATTWENEGENGPWHNTTVVHTYRDGEEYKESNSYSETQLLELSAVAQMTHAWIIGRKAELRSQRRGNRTEQPRF